MLENIQKTQLVENEDTYFDLLSYFMFKSQIGGIYGLMGLDKKEPFASGLKPNILNDSQVRKQYSCDYLHNNSSSNVVRKDSK